MGIVAISAIVVVGEGLHGDEEEEKTENKYYQLVCVILDSQTSHQRTPLTVNTKSEHDRHLVLSFDFVAESSRCQCKAEQQGACLPPVWLKEVSSHADPVKKK